MQLFHNQNGKTLRNHLHANVIIALLQKQTKECVCGDRQEIWLNTADNCSSKLNTMELTETVKLQFYFAFQAHFLLYVSLTGLISS